MVTRALLGVAGATLAPSTMSLIRNMFHDAHERQFAIGVWIASFSAGSAVGPLVGGVMLQFFDWRSVFLVAVPVMALLLLLGPKLLPEYRDPAAGRVDLPSVMLSLGAILGGVYALKQLAEFGTGVEAVTLLLVALLMCALFVRRQSRIAYPLLDLRLFRNPRFNASLAAYGLSCLAMFGIYIFITQYLQIVLGMSPLRAGLTTLPWALAFVGGSLLAPRLARRTSPGRVLVAGLGLGAAGLAALALPAGDWAVPVLVAGTVAMSLGLAPVFTVGNEIIITAAPPERAGAASATAETASELSAALGIALLGSLGMVGYRLALAAAVPPSLAPELAAQALATVAGAMSAAAQLPAAEGDALRLAAQGAFTDALHFVAGVGAAVVWLAAVVAARLLRGSRRLAQALSAPPK